jgi:hypothetical protein
MSIFGAFSSLHLHPASYTRQRRFCWQKIMLQSLTILQAFQIAQCLLTSIWALPQPFFPTWFAMPNDYMPVEVSNSWPMSPFLVGDLETHKKQSSDVTMNHDTEAAKLAYFSFPRFTPNQGHSLLADSADEHKMQVSISAFLNLCRELLTAFRLNLSVRILFLNGGP